MSLDARRATLDMVGIGQQRGGVRVEPGIVSDFREHDSRRRMFRIHIAANRRAGRAVLAVVAAFSLLAVACSSSSADSGKDSAASIPTTEIPTQSKDAASAALLPSEIASSGKLVFAMDPSYPPNEFLAPGTSKIVGMDADLGTAIAQTLGLTSVQQSVSFDAIIPGIQAKKYDAGLSSFTDTKEREKVLDFVNYFTAGEAFYVKAGSTKSFTSVDSLCGNRVAVQAGTVEETKSKEASTTCTQSGKGAVNVLSFPDQNGANLAVASGRADVGYADSPVVGYVVATSNGAFQQSGSAFDAASYGIVVAKGSALASAIQSALKVLIANGTYGAIMKKWGTEAGAVTASGVTINGATS